MYIFLAFHVCNHIQNELSLYEWRFLYVYICLYVNHLADHLDIYVSTYVLCLLTHLCSYICMYLGVSVRFFSCFWPNVVEFRAGQTC